MPTDRGRRVGHVPTYAAALAVAAGLLPGTAHAGEAYVTTSDGLRLYAGTVVGSGQRNGDVCSFPGLPPMRFEGSNTHAATFTADADCTLYVSRLTEIALRPLPVSPGVRPKYVEDAGAVSAGPSGGVGIDVGPVHVGTGPLPAPRAWQREVFTVYVTNTVYDTAGQRRYEDWMQAEYSEEWTDTDGRVRDLRPLDGACVGGVLGQVFYDPVTTIRNCWYRRTANGDAEVAFETGGWYREGVRVASVSVVTDEREMSERVRAWYGDWDYECDPGSIPVYWGTECWGDRVPY